MSQHKHKVHIRTQASENGYIKICVICKKTPRESEKNENLHTKKQIFFHNE